MNHIYKIRFSFKYSSIQSKNSITKLTLISDVDNKVGQMLVCFY